MKTTFLITVSLFLCCSNIFAQACGCGIFTFNIYVLNGEKIENLNYEIITIPQDSVNTFFNEPFERGPSLYKGTMVDSEKVEKLLTTQNKVNDLDLNKFLIQSDISKMGLIKNGQIRFKTYETVWKPLLLKISDGKQNIYILANIFGGCNRTTNVLWSINPVIN